MYHEEKVIDGCLCWRGTPTGKWVPYTETQLTFRLINAERECDRLRLLIPNPTAHRET